MENKDRPASRNRRRSILTTTSSSSAAGITPEVCSIPRSPSAINRNKQGSRVGSGYYENNQNNLENLNANSSDPNHTTPSVFRSPSMEERLAQFGISINLGAAAGGGATDSWKHLDNLNNSSGGESGHGGGGSGRSVNSMGGEGADDRKDLIVRKSTRLSSDISKRISGISSSMEVYDKKVRNVQETMQTAYKNTVQDRKNLRKSKESESPIGGNSSPDSGSLVDLELDADEFLQKCRESLKKDLLSDFDNCSTFMVGPGGDNNNNGGGNGNIASSVLETSSPRKVFGLDAAAVLKSSSSEDSDSSESSEEIKSEDDSEESSSEEEDGAAAMKISIRHPNSTGKAVKSAAMKRFEENIKNRSKQQQERQNKEGKPPLAARAKKKQKKPTPNDLLPPRSLSPIMPTVPDKQFQTILERREERVSRHLTSMKNEIAQLNHKVEMDKKKASSSNQKSRGSMPHSYQGVPMRVLKNQSDKSLGSEFNSFVQSTGGQAGGWERKDHNSFVKVFDVWRKHPNKLMEALKKELPQKKPQDIASHIKWFERFEQLNSANKANVYQWSQEKRRENELIFQMGSASQRAKLEGDKRRQERLRMIREQERDRSKEQLAQWKWKTTQAVRSVTSATSSQAAPNTNLNAEGALASSNSAVAFPQHHQKYMHRSRPPSTMGEPRERPATTSNVRIADVNQDIIEMTAKVHALDNPKRDFRPPRPAVDPRRNRSRQGEQLEEGLRTHNNISRLGVSKSFTNVLAPHPPPPGSSMIFGKSEANVNVGNRIKLPGIEPEPPRTRPKSSSTIRPPSSSLRHQQQQNNRILMTEYRERDNRLVEAKKKAVEIARERRKSNLSQLTPEDIKRRVRSRVTRASSSFLNPTKQSELRKTLTHLERLEMLSKQDLNRVAGASYETEVADKLMSPSLMMINNLPSKGIPTWRRSSGGVGEHF